jgi:lysyl endopeptidase
MSPRFAAILTIGGVALFSACSTTGPAPAVAARPPACSPALAQAPALLLPSPRAPAEASNRKGQPLRYAEAAPVGRTSSEFGQWSWPAAGWRVWRARFTSPGARSLSLHVEPLDLPPGAELWICGPDGTRHGPYVAAPADPGRALWTPIVRGEELWAELVVPDAAADQVRLKVAEAFPAFR